MNEHIVVGFIVIGIPIICLTIYAVIDRILFYLETKDMKKK